MIGAMSTSQKAANLGTEDARRIAASIGPQLRDPRVALGLSLRSAAKAIGVSPSRLSRLERGIGSDPSMRIICQAARVIGLEASIRLFPAGTPVRDAGHLALLARFEDLLAFGVTMRREVPLTIKGDQRAWDALVADARSCAFVEAETRLGDIQALNRRVELKLRDDPRSTIVILVVARTRHNLQVLREYREALRAIFPLDGAAIARSLRAGRVPLASGIIVL